MKQGKTNNHLNSLDADQVTEFLKQCVTEDDQPALKRDERVVVTRDGKGFKVQKSES